ADGALTKLTAAGIDPVREPGTTVSVEDPAELTAAAVVAEAMAEGRVLGFAHTAPGAVESARRGGEPWGTGSRHGHGHVGGRRPAAGIDPARARRPTVSVEDPAELTAAAVVAEAVAEGRVLGCAHTAPGAVESTRRRVEPWWTGSRHGHWYVVGHDLDRGEPR